MSLKNLTRMVNTIGFRITLWYFVIFSLSFLALFSILYFYVSSSLTREQHLAIRAKLKEVEADYMKGGLRALKEEIELEEQTGKMEAYFVRFSDSGGATIYIKWPQWMKGLEIMNINNSTPWWLSLMHSAKGKKYLEIASSVLPDGNIIQVGRSAVYRERLLERFRETFGGGIIIIIILGFGGGTLIAIRALLPVRNIINTVRTIEEGRLDARVNVRQTGDELEELSLLFNRMLQRIEGLVNGMRSALDSVAHDLRTPMTRLRNTAESAIQAKDIHIQTCREALSDCMEESEQILRMLNTLMDISEAETGVMRLNTGKINLSSLINEVVDLYRYVAEDRGISISADLSDKAVLIADPDRIRQVIANLLDNAIKYTSQGGRVSIRADMEDGHVFISVKDTGRGIPEDELPRIWDRLYRGKGALSQKGLGLGLSLVRAVVYAHHGRIEAFSREGVGTDFRVYLPDVGK